MKENLFDNGTMDRFFTKVEVRGPEECWPWTASVNKGGYGRFKDSGSVINASRFALEIHLNRRLLNLLACHTCDNRLCCNPQHLYAGTQKQNLDDAYSRNRRLAANMAGKNNPAAKLNEHDVADIRLKIAMGQTNIQIALEYLVSDSLISAIRRGKVWR